MKKHDFLDSCRKGGVLWFEWLSLKINPLRLVAFLSLYPVNEIPAPLLNPVISHIIIDIQIQEGRGVFDIIRGKKNAAGRTEKNNQSVRIYFETLPRKNARFLFFDMDRY